MITKVEIRELLHSSRYVVENVVDNARKVVKDYSSKLTDKQIFELKELEIDREFKRFLSEINRIISKA